MKLTKSEYQGFLEYMERKQFLCPSCKEKVNPDYDTLMRMVNNLDDGHELLSGVTLKFVCPACEEVNIELNSSKIIESYLGSK